MAEKVAGKPCRLNFWGLALRRRRLRFGEAGRQRVKGDRGVSGMEEVFGNVVGFSVTLWVRANQVLWRQEAMRKGFLRLATFVRRSPAPHGISAGVNGCMGGEDL